MADLIESNLIKTSGGDVEYTFTTPVGGLKHLTKAVCSQPDLDYKSEIDKQSDVVNGIIVRPLAIPCFAYMADKNTSNFSVESLKCFSSVEMLLDQDVSFIVRDGNGEIFFSRKKTAEDSVACCLFSLVPGVYTFEFKPFQTPIIA